MTPVVFVGGVEASWHCLKALCEMQCVPDLVFGYSKDLSHRAGYRDFSDLQKKYGFELIRTNDINRPEFKARLKALSPEIIFVIGWSQLVDAEILKIPRLGCVGIHPTRLPEGRGRAPIPWTFIKGLKKSAVTLLFLEEKADTGDIIDQKEFEVELNDDAASLYAKIERLHAQLIRDNLASLLKGDCSRIPQDSNKATVWSKRRPEDGRISWNKPGFELYNWVRGLTHPYPGAFAFCQGKKLFVWKADHVRQLPTESFSPGTVVAETKDGGILVSAAQEGLILRKIQWEGEKEEIDAGRLLRDRMIKIGDRLE